MRFVTVFCPLTMTGPGETRLLHRIGYSFFRLCSLNDLFRGARQVTTGDLPGERLERSNRRHGNIIESEEASVVPESKLEEGKWPCCDSLKLEIRPASSSQV